MAQYKHDRFFKFYIQALYKSKGATQQNIQVRNDEDLEIDLMFISDQERAKWEDQDLGLLDRLMKVHPTIIVEHYSSYLEETDLHKSITRKNLYWEPKQKELINIAKKEQNSNRLSKEATEQVESQNPFTWILAVNCSDKLLTFCDAQIDPKMGVGIYRLAQFLRMGIVIISRLEDNTETMWLKMLGDKESAQRAFSAIEQFSSDGKKKNDIMSACIKYCVYLKGIPNKLLTSEEQDFMKTMTQIDEWYEAELNQAKLQGLAQGQLQGEQLQKQSIALNLLRKNIDLATIAEATGLTIEELQALQ
jgi:hypothetical protein